MIGLVAIAFVAGSIMTGTLADAAKEAKIDPVAAAIDNLTAVMQGTATQGPAGSDGSDGAKGDKGDKGDIGDTGDTGAAGEQTVLATYKVEGTNLSSTDRNEEVFCDSGDKILTGYFSLNNIQTSSTVPIQRSFAIFSDEFIENDGWHFAVSDAIGTKTVRVFISCLDLSPLRP